MALMTRRMQALGLDPAQFAQDERVALRDFQRACSACAARERCALDLASDDPLRSDDWRDYCCNAPIMQTIRARALKPATSLH
jgi:hypothetical protein